MALGFRHRPGAQESGDATYLLLAGPLVNGVLSGDLVRSSGPLPGAAYDPAGVSRAVVGSASISFLSERQASFSYSYEGRSGTIALERFSFAEESLGASWTYASSGSSSDCMASSANAGFADSGELTLTRAGSALSLTLASISGKSCTHQITVARAGSFYRGEGTFACTSGTGGTVELERMRTFEEVLMLRYNARVTSGETCRESGRVVATPKAASATPAVVTTTSGFAKKVSVFGVSILATATVPDDKVLHAAKVMAGYLDNDGDGVADDAAVVAALSSRGAFLFMLSSEAEQASVSFDNQSNGQNLFAFETRPEGSGSAGFDATLEEVLHLISHLGYGTVYPAAFGESAGSSALTAAMDVARGGQFSSIPASYPAGAWYTYSDATCDYACQATEYFYWTLSAILGAQDYAGRAAEIANEYQLSTRALVESRDPGAFALITDPRYKLPTRIPDGRYSALPLVITAP